MTDRELLELAAKAAELEFIPSSDGGSGVINGVIHQQWNPLTDDGDAIRLAVYLQTPIFITNEIARCVWGSLGQGERCDELVGADPFAATRRAIVRAAAEIGKAMK